MISEDVLFVLGAGASMPFGFPSGGQLLGQVIESVEGVGSDKYKLLRNMGFSPEMMKEFGQALRWSAEPSVDAFLEHRPEFIELGKASMAALIMERENPSLIDGAKSDQDWYRLLWLLMRTEHVNLWTRNRCRFITFNYDRSLEFFLFRALMHSFGVQSGAAANILRQIPIVHIHGTLGGVMPGEQGYRGYEPSLSVPEVRRCADGIRIYHEERVEPELDERIDDLVRESSRVCFLGFGFLEENVKRLGILDKKDGRSILGTAYQMKPQWAARAKTLFGGSIALGPSHLHAKSYLEEYYLPA